MSFLTHPEVPQGIELDKPEPKCKLCKDEGRVMQNPTGDHDGINWLSCPVCQLDRLREEASHIEGASLNEDRLAALRARYL